MLHHREEKKENKNIRIRIEHAGQSQGEVSRTFPSRTFRVMRGSETTFFFGNQQKQSSFLCNK